VTGEVRVGCFAVPFDFAGDAQGASSANPRLTTSRGFALVVHARQPLAKPRRVHAPKALGSVNRRVAQLLRGFAKARAAKQVVVERAKVLGRGAIVERSAALGEHREAGRIEHMLSDADQLEPRALSRSGWRPRFCLCKFAKN
jgi:hypothetical protein